LESYFPDSKEGGKKAKVGGEDKASWGEFWRICVDGEFPPFSALISPSQTVDSLIACRMSDSLFGSPSLPLKALGFSLLQSTLPLLPPSDLPALFGPSTLRVFANHLRKSSSSGNDEKTLSRTADKLASSVLPTYLSLHPTAALPLLKVLTSPPNSHPSAFEHKFLEKIVNKLSLSGVKGWVQYLQGLFLSPPQSLIEEPTTDSKDKLGDEQEENEIEDDAKTLEAAKEKRILAQRTWALDQLLHVARNGGVVKDEEVVRGMVEFLAVVGWFDIKKESDKGAVRQKLTLIISRSVLMTVFFFVHTALLRRRTLFVDPSTPRRSLSILLGPYRTSLRHHPFFDSGHSSTCHSRWWSSLALSRLRHPREHRERYQTFLTRRIYRIFRRGRR